jgi:outer membrane protein assembly factor BamB
MSTGECLNDPEPLAECVSQCPRGWELTLLGGKVVSCGKPFYAHPQYDVYDDTVFHKIFLAPQGNHDIVWICEQHNKGLKCYSRLDRRMLAKQMARLMDEPGPEPGWPVLDWERFSLPDEPLWERQCGESKAVAVCKNAVVVAEESRVVAFNLEDGAVLWSQPLPAAPVTWGMAVDRDGRVIVTLEDGQVLCFG